MDGWCLPPGMASPKVTPASARISAGDLVSGGPVRAFIFSQVSGASRREVKITGILAVASSSATCCG